MRRHIALSVTFQATVIGGDEYIPDSTAAEESVVLTIPMIESKYAVFPKVLEGVTLRTIQQLHSNVGAYLDKKRADEKRRKEFDQMKLRYPDADEEQLEPVEGDDLPFDEMEEDGEGDGGDLDQGDDPEDGETESEGIDFSKIAKDAASALQADGVEVTYQPATGRGE